MKDTATDFSSTDLERLARLGITREEAQRQISLFQDPPPPIRLDRPARPSDGIVTLPQRRFPDLLSRAERAAAEGRFTKMVPASGAASRMFQSLFAFLERDGEISLGELDKKAAEGDKKAADAARFLKDISSFAFHDELASVMREEGDDMDLALLQGRGRTVLRALLTPLGLHYAETPKGLIAFHRSAEGPRTPFAEHLVEAAATIKDTSSVARVHYTVSPEHRELFEAHLATIRKRLEAPLAVRFEVSFSTQSHATDTIAVDLQNRPFRDEQGEIVFRPGGHGALIRNLAELSGDVVFVKNIDNVVPDSRKADTILWKKLLAGHLLEVRDEVESWLAKLEADESAAAGALTFLREAFGLEPAPGAAARTFAIERLDRPLRVCGVVKNEGEPGGGPFWVVEKDGSLSKQIVESSQVDMKDEPQKAIWGSSTHFNPVDLVCSLCDRRGRPYDLARYVDPATVFISQKSAGGRPLKALEQPGLWNGAMAGWNTVFVEVPITTFAPVKTILDLLRAEHQA